MGRNVSYVLVILYHYISQNLISIYFEQVLISYQTALMPLMFEMHPSFLNPLHVIFDPLHLKLKSPFACSTTADSAQVVDRRESKADFDYYVHYIECESRCLYSISPLLGRCMNKNYECYISKPVSITTNRCRR